MAPDYELPLRNTEDIPIHRASVSAHSLNGVPFSEFKPYVYRGTGVDQIAMAAWLVSEAEREAERIRQHGIEVARLRALRQRREDRARREEKRQREDEARAIQSIPYLISSIYDGIEEASRRRSAQERDAARDRIKRRRQGRRIAHASPEWKPSTGADIEQWLREL